MSTPVYRNVYVVGGDGPTPSNMRKAQDADLVLFHHGDGTFTVWKDRYGSTTSRVSWDDLPTHVKRAVEL